MPTIYSEGYSAIWEMWVKKALESLAKQIECCDTLFIYVASHGSMTGDVIYQVRDSTGQVINIKNEDPRTAPSEMESKSQKYMGQQLADGTRTRLRSDGSSYLEKVPKNYQLMIRTKKGAKAEVVLGSELANLLKEIKSCKKLLLLDTSHSAAIFHFTAAVPGLFTIAASDVGVTAQQSWRGGDFTVPFVNAYTESTEEADSDGDGHVTPREAASFADSSIQGEAQLIIDSYRKKLEANGRTPEQIIEELRRWINPGFRWLRASRLWNQDPQFQTPKQLCICSAQLELRTRIPLATTAAAETVAPSPTATRQSSGTATPTATVTPTPEPQPAATLVPTPPPTPTLKPTPTPEPTIAPSSQSTPTPPPLQSPQTAEEATGRIDQFYDQREQFPSKSLGELLNIEQQLIVDIRYLNGEELQRLAELDDLLLSTADVESNISTTSSGLGEAEDEARVVLEQILVELNQGLETLEMEIATVQAELGQLRSTRERGETTFIASQQAIQQK